MSYSTHYRIQYKRFSGNQTTIDILDSSYVGSIIPINAATDPLNITLDGDANNVFASTVGSGIDINVLATPLTLQNLFTYDPQKFMIKIYNGTSGNNLFWQGFLNTGIYNESYSNSISLSTSEIALHCNDGMTVLDSIYYIQNDGSTFYTGNSTIGVVLTNILGKLGLTFNNVLMSNDLTTQGNNHNLLTQLQVNNENFIDESQITMTCREVLDSIFGGLGLSFSFKGSNIYIIDPINLHDTTKGKVYDLATFTENSSIIGGYIDISNKDINWWQTGSELDIIPQVDEVDVKYNPYNVTGFDYDFTKNASSGSLNHITSPSPNDFYKNTTVMFPNWTQSGGSHFRGIKETVDDTPIYYLYIDGSSDELVWTIPFSNINSDSLLSLRINLDSYLQTKINDNVMNDACGDNIYSSNAKTQFYNYYISYKIKIGSQYWNGISWTTTPSNSVMAVRDWTISNSVYIANNSKSQVGDTWCPIKPIIIPLNGITGGSITFYVENILIDTMINPNYQSSDNPTSYLSKIFRKLLLKNIKIDFCTTSGVAIDNSGVLKKGNVTVNSIYKKNIKEIGTTSGTGPFGVSKGTFLETNNQSIIGYSIYRDSDGTAKTIEERVLQSYVSQYKQPRFTLTGSLDVANYMLNVNMKLIKDSTYQGSRAFYIVNGTYNDKEERMDVKMVEITSTRDSI
jgi:hypothetical protein